MKNYLTYIGILAAGLLLGWILFGGSSNNESGHDHIETVESSQTWTCSMHPQIMQPEPGDCPICGMDLIPAASGADGLKADQFKLTENAMALGNVQTTIVGSTRATDNGVQLSGKIVENEESNTVQVSYFSGRIEELKVSFTGEEIRSGQLLATIYSPELYAAQQELITAASIKESQPTLYKAVRNKLKLWKLSEEQINRIETSGTVIENFPVYATVSGTVTEKLVEQGDYVEQGQPLFKIVQLSTVWANFDVYESQIDLFKKGQEVSITSNAHPDKEFKGKVSFIDPILDNRTRTVKLRVVLSNTNNIFKPGMFVKGKIKEVSSGEEQMLSIPSTAVLWTGKRSVVYLKTHPEEPVFEMREVQLGSTIGDNIEVLSGLMDGDEIVTHGTFTIDAAAQLQGKKSMMNKHGGRSSTGHEGHGVMEREVSNPDQSEAKELKRIEVSPKFQQQLKQIFESYIALKDALASDDSEKAQAEASIVENDLENVNMKLLTDAKAHQIWMELAPKIQDASRAVSSSSSIDEQRNTFKDLSVHLTHAVEVFGINQKVYNQFCPMADNNKGAYWLSANEIVENPYFGSAMHSCGNVAEIFD